MGFLSKKQLVLLGLKHVGNNVSISDKASFYNLQNISIGDNSRIDDFVVISAGVGGIQIGKNVHIAIYSSLIGKGEIILEDFANISSKVSIYSSSDDYSGESMTNPTISEKFKNVIHGGVYIKKHVIIGPGSIVLPNVTVEEGVAIGALSLVKQNCKRFYIYAGIPAKKIKKRSKNLLLLEQEFKHSYE